MTMPGDASACAAIVRDEFGIDIPACCEQSAGQDIEYCHEEPPPPQQSMITLAPTQAGGVGRRASPPGSPRAGGAAAKQSKPAVEPVGQAASEVQGLEDMDEHKALLFANWLCYLCCAGVGTSPVSSHLSADAKCCCCFSKCGTEPDTSEDGCCSVVHTCCCATLVCQCPSRKGHPSCKVCNVPCCRVAPRRRKADDEETTFAKYDAIREMFVPCYCCCAGCAVAPGFLEVCGNRLVCGGCEQRCGGMASDCSEESLRYGWFGCFLACHRCYAQCKLPFLCSESPIVACCGRKCRDRSKARDHWPV